MEEERMIDCPLCDTDGEFYGDDVYTCPLCEGRGFITESRYEEWKKEQDKGE